MGVHLHLSVQGVLHVYKFLGFKPRAKERKCVPLQEHKNLYNLYMYS